MRTFILILLTTCSIAIGYCQHGFPTGHWCNTPQGWDCQRCKALWGLKNDQFHKVITVPHRGIWGGPNEAEGNLDAVKEAYNQGYMFIEIDIVMTRDFELLLFHDQQTNRATDLPATFSTDGNMHDNGSFVRNMNWNSSTLNVVPGVFGNNYPTFPALNTGYYKDRFGNVTDQRLGTLDELFAWCEGKELVIAVDIKCGTLSSPVIMQEYLKTISLCLTAASSHNMLPNIIIKAGTSGQVELSEIRDYLTLTQQWGDFSMLTNVILVNISNFPSATNKTYLDQWLDLPSLIGVEHIYKTYSDPLLQARTEFGNKSVIQYTQDRGFRTGVFHPIPNNERGAAGGRNNYFNPDNFGELTDLRGSLEFIFGVPESNLPGMIVTDRPDVDNSFLQLYDLDSSYTFRSSE